MEHKLKILSKYYEAILQGKKTFEVRKDDRPFSEGDTLLLQECVTPYGCGYTGREMTVDVTYVLRDSEYVKDGYCIMGIKIISTNKSRYYGNKPSRNAVLSEKSRRDVMKMRNLTDEEAEIYDQRLNAEAIEVNKRIDDAFMELNTQRNLASSLIRDYRELKEELLRLQDEQKSTLLWTRILTGISAAMWVILLILKFV